MSRKHSHRKHSHPKPVPIFSRKREECPNCKSKKIKYSAFFLKNLKRLVTGSRTRYCAACGAKWSAKMGRTSSKMMKKKRLAILAGFLVLLMISLWFMVNQKTTTELLDEEGASVQTEADQETPLAT